MKTIISRLYILDRFTQDAHKFFGNASSRLAEFQIADADIGVTRCGNSEGHYVHLIVVTPRPNDETVVDKAIGDFLLAVECPNYVGVEGASYISEPSIDNIEANLKSGGVEAYTGMKRKGGRVSPVTLNDRIFAIYKRVRNLVETAHHDALLKHVSKIPEATLAAFENMDDPSLLGAMNLPFTTNAAVPEIAP